MTNCSLRHEQKLLTIRYCSSASVYRQGLYSDKLRAILSEDSFSVTEKTVNVRYSASIINDEQVFDPSMINNQPHIDCPPQLQTNNLLLHPPPFSPNQLQ